MRKALPTPPESHGKHPEYKPHNLAATGFVYVRHDAHCGPLQRPYTGPFKILETAEKHFVLNINGRRDAVSVDRLKVAYGQDTRLYPPPLHPTQWNNLHCLPLFGRQHLPHASADRSGLLSVTARWTTVSFPFTGGGHVAPQI